MQATILMPADAPVSKRERTKSYGAEVVLYDRDTRSRGDGERHCRKARRDPGAPL